MILEEFYNLMPAKDCRVCGSLSCRTFARKIIRGTSKVEDCPHMLSGDLSKNKSDILKALSSNAVSLPRLSKARKSMLIIHPCHAKGKKMGEFQIEPENDLFGVFDFKALCTLVSGCSEFSDAKFSGKLGVASFGYGEKIVFVFSSGLIRIKQAKDKEDIIKSAEFVLKKIIKSIILESDETLGEFVLSKTEAERKGKTHAFLEKTFGGLLGTGRAGKAIREEIS